MADNPGFLYKTLHAIESHIIGTIIAAVVLGGAASWAYKLYSAHEQASVEKARIQAGLELKVGDYNGNPTLDKFFEIEGKKIPVEIDGKPIEQYFNH